MADDYASDCPISVPLYISTVDPDVNLNGMSFSYNIGLFYVPNTVIQPFKLPPPFSGSI
jgi:hypothetical protein